MFIQTRKAYKIFLIPYDYPEVVFNDSHFDDICNMVYNAERGLIEPKIKYMTLIDGYIKIVCLDYETKVWFIRMSSSWDAVVAKQPFLNQDSSNFATRND